MPFKPTFDAHFVVNEVLAAQRIEEHFGALSAFVPLDGWSISYQTLLHTANYLTGVDSPLVLEFGSGSGTVWLAKILSALNGKLISIEHDAEFYDDVSQLLSSEGLSRLVDYHLCPLTEIESPPSEFSAAESSTVTWYKFDVPEPIAADVVIVDGPPAGEEPEARFPILPRLLNWLKPSALVLIDDIDRQHDLQLANRFKKVAREEGHTIKEDAVANTMFMYLSDRS